MSVAQLLPKTIRGEFTLVAVSLALPLVALIGYGLYDRALLRQLWANLIGNALKYSARREAPRVEIGGRIDGAENIYWVRDNGAGFDMRYYDKLFKMFQRLHGEEEFDGTGGGLAIVERVIARHGGRAWGEGAVGAGACFSFALPKEG